MIIRNKDKKDSIKRQLVDCLKEEHAFWSYEPSSVSADSIDEDELIAMTMRYLDLPQIQLLFSIFSFKKIKHAWQRLLVPEGEYLYTLNRFFAWYYFKAKKPDSYLKMLETRSLMRLQY